MTFYLFKLNLNPITLILKLDLDMVNMYACTVFLTLMAQKFKPEQTDRQT